jgi:hypothetical protein
MTASEPVPQAPFWPVSRPSHRADRRHANIATTMMFSANVGEAVEEAVLGPQRNTSRNIQPIGGQSRSGDETQTADGERP